MPNADSTRERDMFSSEGSTSSVGTHSTRGPLVTLTITMLRYYRQQFDDADLQLSAKQDYPFSVAVKIFQCFLRFTLMALMR